jgi:hypothetical protein
MILSPLPQKAIRTEISQSTKKPNVMGTLGGKIVRDLPGVTPRLRVGGLSANDDNVAAIQAWAGNTTWGFLCVFGVFVFGSARLRDRKPRWVRGNLNFLYDALAEDFQGSKWGHPVVV